MQHLEVSGAVRPLKWSLGGKWLIKQSSLQTAVPGLSDSALCSSKPLSEPLSRLAPEQRILLKQTSHRTVVTRVLRSPLC